MLWRFTCLVVTFAVLKVSTFDMKLKHTFLFRCPVNMEESHPNNSLVQTLQSSTLIQTEIIHPATPIRHLPRPPALIWENILNFFVCVLCVRWFLLLYYRGTLSHGYFQKTKWRGRKKMAEIQTGCTIRTQRIIRFEKLLTKMSI